MKQEIGIRELKNQASSIVRQVSEESAEIAADYKIRGCDLLYVALAESLNEKLITLDKAQKERVKSLIQTITPNLLEK